MVRDGKGPQGIHLTADLAGCDAAHPWMCDPDALRRACLDAVAASGLQPVGERFHRFAGVLASASSAQPHPHPAEGTARNALHALPPGDHAGGVTGVVLLAESHLAVHTWPEHGVVTLDVFVCNLLGDNTARARQVLDALVTGFAPARQSVQTIRRCIPTADNT